MNEIYNQFIKERLSCSECGKSCFDKTKEGCENCEHSEFYDLDEDTIQHCLKNAINTGYNKALAEVEKILVKVNCDCEEFGNLKLCGKCFIKLELQKLKEKNDKSI